MGAGTRLVLESPKGDLTEFALRIIFKVTNNKAKYEVVIATLNVAQSTKLEESR